MSTIQANPGESIYDFLQRALQETKSSTNNAVKIKHNTTSIVVYKDSCLNDLCEKFDLQWALDRKNEYYR